MGSHSQLRWGLRLSAVLSVLSVLVLSARPALARNQSPPCTIDSKPRLSNVFQDNMVLQRDAPLKIWGYCGKGDPTDIVIR